MERLASLWSIRSSASVDHRRLLSALHRRSDAPRRSGAIAEWRDESAVGDVAYTRIGSAVLAGRGDSRASAAIPPLIVVRSLTSYSRASRRACAGELCGHAATGDRWWNGALHCSRRPDRQRTRRLVARRLNRTCRVGFAGPDL